MKLRRPPSFEFDFWHRAYSLGQNLAHAHPGLELHFCEQGEGYFRALQLRRPLSPGRVTLLMAPVFHRVIAHRKKEYRRSVLHLPEWVIPDLLSLVDVDGSEFLPTRANPIIQLELAPHDYIDIRRIFQQLWREVRVGRALTSPLAPLYLAEMFYFISRGRVKTDSCGREVSPHDEYVVRQACALIAASAGTALIPDEIARRLRISRGHLWRLFNNVLGMSPQDYIMQRRMELAKNLLRSGTPVAEVARHCGYADPSSFSRAFRTHVGVSPRKFVTRRITVRSVR